MMSRKMQEIVDKARYCRIETTNPGTKAIEVVTGEYFGELEFDSPKNPNGAEKIDALSEEFVETMEA